VLEIFFRFNWTVENFFEGVSSSYGDVDYCIMMSKLLGFTILMPVGDFKHTSGETTFCHWGKEKSQQKAMFLRK
jgi:hypothetical protein